ncbi:hypothetical protein Plhal304r1_c019g0068971 [Plasmopara halstedii]
MQAANNAGSTWRKVFDELLVLEQDFDTAMQILINQDSKVAKLSLEDTHHTRSQHVHDAKVKEASIRCKRRGMSRKRRCSTRESIPRPKPPPIPSSHVSDTTRVVSDIQSNDFLNRLNADRMMLKLHFIQLKSAQSPESKFRSLTQTQMRFSSG